jgi:hypothetical protein
MFESGNTGKRLQTKGHMIPELTNVWLLRIMLEREKCAQTQAHTNTHISEVVGPT